MKLRFATFVACLSATTLSAVTAQAQADRALERRMERNQRQLQRQANRADYYSDQTWQQLNPWLQEYGINPLERTARAAAGATRAAVGAAEGAARAAGNVAEGVARAAGATARGAADAAVDGRLDGRYGYVDRNNQGWFYDYYTYTPTYYYSGDAGDRYAGAIRYFDADDDGIYDSQSYYRDSDNDGTYDEYDRFDFRQYEAVTADAAAQTTEETTSSEVYIGPADARRHQVQGEVAMIKTAKVNGNQNLVVALKQTSQENLAIDLGPADAMQSRVDVGQTIKASGAIESIGERRLLVADSVELDGGQTIQIDRNLGTTLTGVIVDVRETTVGSAAHYMAVVEVDGERQLVDFGPVKTYKVKLQPKAKVVIHGIPVRAHDHRVLMANRVRLGNETITINRSQTLSF